MRGLFMFGRGRVSRVARRKRRTYFVYTILALVSALSFIVLLAYVSHNEDFQIRKVRVVGNALVSESELLARVNPILAGSYFSLFPKRNSLLLPKHEIISVIQNTFPAVDSVAVKRTSFSSVTISVHEREPFVLWCSTEATTEDTAATCSFVDREGLIFSLAPDFSSDVYLRFVGRTSTSTEIGGRIFSPERFREFSFFMQSLRDIGLSPRLVTIEEGAAGIPDFSIELASGARLLVSGKLTLEQTLADVTAFFTDPEIATSSNRFLDKVEYVDFRFENKVYYKLKE